MTRVVVTVTVCYSVTNKNQFLIIAQVLQMFQDSIIYVLHYLEVIGAY